MDHTATTTAPEPGRQRLRHAAYGVLATLVGLAASHLVAAVTVPAASPVLAVGSTVIDLTPTPLKEWAIRQFGSADKLVLVGSVTVVVLLLAALAGVLTARRPTLGLLVVVALAGVAGVLAVLRPRPARWTSCPPWSPRSWAPPRCGGCTASTTGAPRDRRSGPAVRAGAGSCWRAAASRPRPWPWGVSVAG